MKTKFKVHPNKYNIWNWICFMQCFLILKDSRVCHGKEDMLAHLIYSVLIIVFRPIQEIAWKSDQREHIISYANMKYIKLPKARLITFITLPAIHKRLYIEHIIIIYYIVTRFLYQIIKIHFFFQLWGSKNNNKVILASLSKSKSKEKEHTKLEVGKIHLMYLYQPYSQHPLKTKTSQGHT